MGKRDEEGEGGEEGVGSEKVEKRVEKRQMGGGEVGRVSDRRREVGKGERSRRMHSITKM
jgi:hypothetical protein